MARKRLVATLLGGAVLVALLTGCGGGEEENEPPAHLTEAQYKKRTKAICTEHRAQITNELGALSRKFQRDEPVGKVEARKALTDVILPGVRTQYEEMRRLPPPRGDEDFLDLMLSTFSRSLENGEESLARFFYVKPSSYTEFGEGTVMAWEYGSIECGSFGRSLEAVVRNYALT
jgi:hypothetical protein